MTLAIILLQTPGRMQTCTRQCQQCNNFKQRAYFMWLDRISSLLNTLKNYKLEKMQRYSLLWNAKLLSLTIEQFPTNHSVRQNVRIVVPNVDIIYMHRMKEPALTIDLKQRSNQNTLDLNSSFVLDEFNLMTIADSMQIQTISTK
jgi:hypothetical protein